MRCLSSKHGYRTAGDTMRGCRIGHRHAYRCHTCAAWDLGRAIRRPTDLQELAP